ncbi:bifunctional methylenetetrahydrofolate dehydrogenase/methenyltetrahydrofolate cyclohydrolase FolD [Maricaulis sp.]|uniref:bifunctional methylenetetrahydrofolate dehydrogenase/methenyltetrahydrofolate cyclohydrolase FolD n=1 Tax=Maricaulis sp. TaxID=1486257 RepID=UPI00262AE5C8|nr:bifunctional methylenetetrahydrofolate dehydrogenase/methenyltetrahydrofolate cyclohydrolase FolD [Maricaulis sp.]
MSAELIDGKAVSAEIDARAGQVAAELAKSIGRPPCLAVVLIGDDPASDVYVRNKARRTEAAGMRSIEIRKPAETSEAEVIEIVNGLNADEGVDGILVQMPLPGHIDTNRVIGAIDPDKDVDGLTEASAGRLVLGKPGLRPCTPAGCVLLAERAMGDISGKSVVVIGRSILVGKPAALLFLERNATVTIAHSRTQDLPGLVRTADIVVPAVGRPEMVRGDWVKPGACVLDVGINRIDAPERGPGKTRLVGDAAFDEIVGHAGWITPVPGGIGPMTIAMLLRNTVLAAGLRYEASIPAGF